MDITTHAVTLISIIVGIGLTEMFGNLHRLIRNRAQVRWDWLPVTWSAALLVLVVNYWWSIYLGVGIDQLTSAAQLGLVLIQPILLFLLTASVLPNFDAASEWDMRRHYDEHRKTFILTFILYQCLTWATAAIVGAFGWNLPSVIRGLILAILLLLVVLNKRRWDWVGVLAILGFLVFRLTTQVTR